MSEWLPIETAPRDGTKILVFTRWVGDAASIGPEPFEEVQIAFFEANGECGTEELVCSYIGDPVCWMPLPKPPETPSEASSSP